MGVPTFDPSPPQEDNSSDEGKSTKKDKAMKKKHEERGKKAKGDVPELASDDVRRNPKTSMTPQARQARPPVAPPASRVTWPRLGGDGAFCRRKRGRFIFITKRLR